MSRSVSYIPKLDGLRAIAALMVLGTHFVAEVIGPKFRSGGMGVDIFFVISGFLITSILLAQKERAATTKGKIYGKFVIRRALRLFPVYYLFLIAVVVLSRMTNVYLTDKGDLWYYFTYTQNILMLEHGFSGSILNHTWSLAVEEQFYLLWPLLLLWIPKRSELLVLVTVFIAGFLARIWYIHFFQGAGTSLGATPMHFTTLGAGAILAWLVHNKKTTIVEFIGRWNPLIFIVTLAGCVAIAEFELKLSVVAPLLIVVLGVSLVVAAIGKKNPVVDPLLNSKSLQSIGTVSYALYLFHKPILFALVQLSTRYFKLGTTGIVLLALLFVLLSVGAAYLSWFIVERPIQRYKERFDL